MRILFLLHRFPYPPTAGGPWQTFNLIQQLAHTHECDILSFQHPDDRPDLDEFRRRIPNARVLGVFKQRRLASSTIRDEVHRGLPDAFRNAGRALWYFWRFRVARLFGQRPWAEYWRGDFARAVADATASGAYDVVHVETIMLSPYRAYCGDVTTVASPYDALAGWIDSYLERARGFGRAVWLLCRRSLVVYERVAYSGFSLVCVVTPVERRRLLNCGATVEVDSIPISVDDKFFEVAAPARQTGRRTVFIPASMTLHDPPTVDLLSRFLRDEFQELVLRHDVEALVSYGRADAALLRPMAGRPGVTLAGWVPDFAAALRDADIVLFTDRRDCGIKNRVVQAMAAGRPVVATPEAAAGTGAQDGIHLLVRETPQEMVAAVDMLLSDAGAAARLSAAARAFARDHFSAAGVAARWEHAYCRAKAHARTAVEPFQASPTLRRMP